MNWSQFRRARGKAVIVLATVSALAAVTGASAVHVDSMFKTANYNPDCFDGSIGDGHFCQTDNDFLTVFRQSSLTSTGKSNIASVLNNEFAPTDLSISFVSDPSYSGSAETDIIYQQGTVPATVFAVTWCNDAVSSTKCDQHYVRFENDTPPKKTACHETGHGVGLTHGQQASPKLSNGDDSLGCLTNPAETSDLGAHNTNMINATYPN
jgi:hypothetical protein